MTAALSIVGAVAILLAAFLPRFKRPEDYIALEQGTLYGIALMSFLISLLLGFGVR